MQDIERSAMRKVALRVLLVAFACQALNYIDRVNLSFAALTMSSEIGLVATQFGLGAGVFFISYAILEVPSNVILHRVGANVWISRILISCGITASLMAFIVGPRSFYLVRFLFGAAEAGLIPGIMLYLTYWYPQRHRALAFSFMSSAVGLVGIVAGPLSSLITETMHGVAGLSGWRWMFIMQGLPVAALGLGMAFWLTPRPERAGWLDDAERRWLVRTLAQEAPAEGHGRIGIAFRTPRVWLLAGVYFLFLVAVYGLQLWLPQIIKSAGQTSNVSASLLSAGPPFISVVFGVLLGWSSDRLQERRLHLALSLVAGGVLLIFSTRLTAMPLVCYLTFCCAWGALFAPLGIFWTMAGSVLSGVAAAAGLAFVNTVAQAGGFVGPYVIGYIRETTGSFVMAIIFCGAVTIAAGLLALGARATRVVVREVKA